jgi:phage terminase small subunit
MTEKRTTKPPHEPTGATLTAKQEAFCQAIADGMTQADAYRTAYNAGKMKPDTVHVKASTLMADGKIAARVAELRSKLAQKQLWTREMSVKALVRAYKVAEDGGQSTAMTAAVKELNAMHGYNAPAKVDLMNTDGSMTRQMIDASALSQQTLTELLHARSKTDQPDA